MSSAPAPKSRRLPLDTTPADDDAIGVPWSTTQVLFAPAFTLNPLITTVYRISAR
jgi:hypothetical protein